MSTKIIESLVKSKSINQHDCEDFLIINDNYIALIDGATSKSNIKINGLTGGLFIATLISEALRSFVEFPEPKELVSFLSRKIQNGINSQSVNAPGANAVIAIYLKKHNCILRVGDVNLMINEKSFTAKKKIDQITSDARAAYCSALLQSKSCTQSQLTENDLGREFIMPLLQLQHVFQNNNNTPYGYGCLDGNMVPDEFIDIFPLSSGDTVVMASDGYPMLSTSLKKSEEYLANELMSDALRIRNHTETKGFNPNTQTSFDDRSYVKFKVS